MQKGDARTTTITTIITRGDSSVYQHGHRLKVLSEYYMCVYIKKRNVELRRSKRKTVYKKDKLLKP